MKFSQLSHLLCKDLRKFHRCKSYKDVVSRVRPTRHNHNIGNFVDDFYGPDDPTKSDKAPKEASLSSRSDFNPTVINPLCYNIDAGSLLF